MLHFRKTVYKFFINYNTRNKQLIYIFKIFVMVNNIDKALKYLYRFQQFKNNYKKSLKFNFSNSNNFIIISFVFFFCIDLN